MCIFKVYYAMTVEYEKEKNSIFVNNIFFFWQLTVSRNSQLWQPWTRLKLLPGPTRFLSRWRDLLLPSKHAGSCSPRCCVAAGTELWWWDPNCSYVSCRDRRARSGGDTGHHLCCVTHLWGFFFFIIFAETPACSEETQQTVITFTLQRLHHQWHWIRLSQLVKLQTAGITSSLRSLY